MKKLIFSAISVVMVLTLTACMEESLREKIITDIESEIVTEITNEEELFRTIDERIDFNDGKSIFYMIKNITFDDKPFEFPIITDELEYEFLKIPSFSKYVYVVFINNKPAFNIEKETDKTFATSKELYFMYNLDALVTFTGEYCEMKINNFSLNGSTRTEINEFFNDFIITDGYFSDTQFYIFRDGYVCFSYDAEDVFVSISIQKKDLL